MANSHTVPHIMVAICSVEKTREQSRARLERNKAGGKYIRTISPQGISPRIRDVKSIPTTAKLLMSPNIVRKRLNTHPKIDLLCEAMMS